MGQELSADTAGLRNGAAILASAAANLHYEAPSPPAQQYAASIGASNVSTAISAFIAAYAARITQHAADLTQAAQRYDATDSDGGNIIKATDL